jgi:hypothetical protein
MSIAVKSWWAGKGLLKKENLPSLGQWMVTPSENATGSMSITMSFGILEVNKDQWGEGRTRRRLGGSLR